jgi:dimeric dUTPase (all-alpha-NTP-PPase superfamily)
MLRLNTSQQLWSRIKWQPRALTELKTGFLQEYSDITHVVQSIGSGYSEALLKDFAYKCNTVYPVLVDIVDHIVSASMTEVSEIYKDFLDMGEEMKNMYRRNDFYLQDILPYVSKFV